MERVAIAANPAERRRLEHRHPTERDRGEPTKGEREGGAPCLPRDARAPVRDHEAELVLVDEDTKQAVGGVSARLEGGARVDEAEHGTRGEEPERVLDAARPRATPIAVAIDEGDQQRVVGREAEVGLGRLVAHHGEKAEEREPVVVGLAHEIDHVEANLAVDVDLLERKGDVATGPPVAFEHEERTALVGKVHRPKALRTNEHPGRAAGLRGIEPGEEVPVLAGRAAHPRRANDEGHERLERDRERDDRRRSHVTEPRVKPLTERIEKRRDEPRCARDLVEVRDEGRRDPTPPCLRSDPERRDPHHRHVAAADPRREPETERVTDDLVAATLPHRRDVEIGERPERLGEEVSPPLVVTARVGERGGVDLDEPLHVVWLGGAERERAHRTSVRHLELSRKAADLAAARRSPEIGPFRSRPVRPLRAMQNLDRDLDAGSGKNHRLAGAGAEFVASLGKKGGEARSVLFALAADPKSSVLRDDLRRRIATIETAARSFRLEELAGAISEGLRLLERNPGEAIARPTIASLNELLFDLPSLAWGETQRRPKGGSFVAEKLATHTALVVGPKVVADALSNDMDSARTYFTCHSCEDAHAAMDMARVVAPDLILLDADLADIGELVEALMDDPLTEPVPMVVVGSFGEDADHGRYVAMGVAKVLSKPLSREALRKACEGAVLTSEHRTERVVLGEPTVEELGRRLAEEMKRALVDAVDIEGRTTRVALGEGTEILGAVWGAIARVREIVTARTDGHVRFSHPAPEGAIAFAPPLHLDAPRYDRGPRRRGPDAEVRLTGRRVLVADDDPGVTWFVADLLKSAGCVVTEAVDGEKALELAYKTTPDLVISDLLMPGLDGFAFCRALRRDVALRDAPFLLLSWKEDLLQRVRELGVGAAGYLRKESDARAIVGRVREVLRPRARIEARLKGDGEIRGRLDDLSVRSLLEIVCATRPEARVSVRDASFHYEVEIRDGAPVSAIRTDPQGDVRRGERVLASMLGIGVGRFVVQDSSGEVVSELSGSLAQQVALPIARARAALYLTTGTRAMSVEEIELDPEILADTLRVSPPEARRVLDTLSRGATPKDLVLGGMVDAAWLDDVMADLAARGAIREVRGASGRELLSLRLSAATAPTSASEKTRTPPPPYEASLVALGDSAAFDLALEREASQRGMPLSPDPSIVLATVAQKPEVLEPTVVPGEVESVAPRAVATKDEESEPALETADATIVDTAYGAPDELSISVPIPEPERTPEPQTADADDELVARPKRKIGGVQKLFALLFAVVAITYVAFQADAHKSSPPKAAAAAAPLPAAPAPQPTYREMTPGFAAGRGGIDLGLSQETVVTIDGVPREKTAHLVETLAEGRHDVRVGERTFTIDVREGKTAVLVL